MILGAPRADLIPGVEIHVDGSVATVTATRDLNDIANGRFANPSCGLAWDRSAWPQDIEFLGFAFTQFAMPVTSGRDLAFDFSPAPGMRSPAAMLPLIARSADRVVLLAPIDQFHEQVVAVTHDGVRWGWHGDLDTVPAGFSVTLGIYSADSVTDAFAAWRDDLAVDDAPPRRTGNPLSTHLSYWTDNGAAYWYRTEPERTITQSIVDKLDELRAHDVPVRSLELDSWFYDHAEARPITEIGYPVDVPPTGMRRWAARTDAFDPVAAGADPISQLQRAVGLPLVLHARHIAPNSPDVTGVEEWWVDEYAAHPKDPAFFRRWFDDARRWGASVIEQDWMQVVWFAVRDLRVVPDRAAHWQRAMNEYAGETDVDLLWCMATPADFMLAASLDHVIAIRTCDDYRFNDDPAFLWTWFLVVNRLAAVLDLPVFKDCFFTNPDVADGADSIDGDRHAALEAALAALSGGPVGIGDRIGRTDREIVMRCSDDDGRLRQVDAPIAAIDRCMFGGPARGDMLMWAATTASTDHGAWRYILAINVAVGTEAITDRLELDAASTVYEWRTGRITTSTSIEIDLEHHGWALFIVSPPGVPAAGEVGDALRYVVVESAPT